jgi:bifunctional UDP-N-acetylglucosamine pyrophosphorylase/glucosamine-1-phosphate N-acetyltransferase
MSCVLDSILGEDCTVAAGVIFSNFRFDEKEIKVLLKGDLVSTGRNKLGAIVGNKTKIGVNTSLMPGSLIGQESVIGPNVLVKGSIPDKSIFYDKHHGNFKSN